MADVAALFDRWAAELARGEQPDAVGYIRAAGAEADQLAAMMDRYLRARPRADPTPERVESARAWLAGKAPLVELRVRHGVRRDEVVDAVMAEFGFAPEKRPVVQRYYHELESGILDPARISGRLLDLLSRVLKTRAASIAAWRPRPLDVAPAFRVAREAAASTAAPAAPARAAREPVEDDAEVRALFISDR